MHLPTIGVVQHFFLLLKLAQTRELLLKQWISHDLHFYTSVWKVHIAKIFFGPHEASFYVCLLPAFKPWVGSHCGAAPALSSPRSMESSGAAAEQRALLPGEADPTSQWGWPIGCDHLKAAGNFRQRQLDSSLPQPVSTFAGRMQPRGAARQPQQQARGVGLRVCRACVRRVRVWASLGLVASALPPRVDSFHGGGGALAGAFEPGTRRGAQQRNLLSGKTKTFW